LESVLKPRELGGVMSPPRPLFQKELLIDFRELVREHSGENLAHVVYNTLNLYGLKGHVSLQVVPGFCTLTLTTHRFLPSMQTMTPWSNTWRHFCSGILFSLVPWMSGCSACLIQFIWRHWRYSNNRSMNSICNLIEFICLAFESNWHSQTWQEGHLSRLCHCLIE